MMRVLIEVVAEDNASAIWQASEKYKNDYPNSTASPESRVNADTGITPRTALQKNSWLT